MIFLSGSRPVLGWVLEIAPNPCWLSGWFSGFITMVLTTIKEMVLIPNHSSQKNWGIKYLPTKLPVVS
jgi:4-hydroxybenzoate polyprenyltransferase